MKPGVVQPMARAEQEVSGVLHLKAPKSQKLGLWHNEVGMLSASPGRTKQNLYGCGCRGLGRDKDLSTESWQQMQHALLATATALAPAQEPQ